MGMSKELQALDMTDRASCPAVRSPASTYEIACMISPSEGAVNNSLIIPLVRAPPSHHAHDAEHRSHQLGKSCSQDYRWRMRAEKEKFRGRKRLIYIPVMDPWEYNREEKRPQQAYQLVGGGSTPEAPKDNNIAPQKSKENAWHIPSPACKSLH